MLVDSILLSWNQIIKELQEWQLLGMAIERVSTEASAHIP